MTHEGKRRERIDSVIEVVKRTKVINRNELAAHISIETGCSLKTANEYIDVAVMARRILVKNNCLCDNGVEQAPQDSA